MRDAAALQADSYDEPLQKYLTDLAKTYQETLTTIADFETEAIQQINTAAQQATQAFQAVETQGTQTLQAEQEKALADVDMWGEQTTAQLQESGQQIVGELAPQLSAFQQQFINYAAEAAAYLQSVPNPMAEDVATYAAAVQQDLQSNQATVEAGLVEWETGAVADLNLALETQLAPLQTLVTNQTTNAETIGTSLSEEVQTGLTNANTAMETVVTDFETELTAAVEATIAEMVKADEAFQSEMQTLHQPNKDALVQVVDDALVSEDAILADARNEMAGAVSDIAGEYSNLKAEAEQKNQQEGGANARIYRFFKRLWNSFTQWVDSVRQWFIGTFGDFWGGLLFGILSALVMVLVGWALMQVAAAILVALGVSAKAAGIAILVGGLIIGAGLGIYNRFQEYREAHGEGPGFWEGAGLTVLGILDLTGIPFVIEGLAGKTATGLELSTAERTERFGMGIVFVGSFMASAKNLLRSSQRPGAGRFATKGGTNPKNVPNGRQVRGKFPKTANPNEILYRVDPKTGKPTYYQQYDANGLPVKRVDLAPSSKPHNGIETPHTQPFVKNTNPKGQTFVKTDPANTRPSTPGEIPGPALEPAIPMRPPKNENEPE